jgi:hypothetical protein
MADTTLTAVPASMYAGDSLDLLISLADYPASDGWVLTYAFRKESGTAISLTSTASGANHLLSATAATTGGWVAGVYGGVGRVALGATVQTVWTGNLEVKPDLSTAGDNYDARSHNQICLDAIRAVLRGKATRDVLSTVIAGQSITRLSPAQLRAEEAYYEARVDAENGVSRKIVIRFLKP